MHQWTVQDRYGNTIYLTEERWQHILESRPELEAHLDKFLETLRAAVASKTLSFPTSIATTRGSMNCYRKTITSSLLSSSKLDLMRMASMFPIISW